MPAKSQDQIDREFQEARLKQIETINRYNWSGNYDWAADAKRVLKIAEEIHEESKQKGQQS